MHEEQHPPSYSPEVASHIPGRLRLRFPRARRHPQQLHRLQAALQARPGISAVTMNPHAASLTVTYDAHQHPGTSIFRVLEELDVLVSGLTGAPHLEDPADAGGPSRAAVSVAAALDDLDRHVLALTGHTLNLRALLPLGLAGLGVALTLRQGLGLGLVPGWLPLWLAFDAFVTLHPHTGESRRVPR
jgi:hypothetical protein